jgi:hypothetical protein
VSSTDLPTRDASRSDGAVRARVRRAVSLGWVPLAASLLSLILSIGSIVIATRDPTVLLILPDQVRFAQATSDGYAYVYLQPTFVSTGNNDRVEVIRGMRLLVSDPSGATAELAWDEVGEFSFSSVDQALSYEYVGDAAPMLVAPDQAQNPLALFQGPPGWLLQAGTYQIELVADREVATAPLQKRFAVDLSEVQVQEIAEADGARFLAVPIRVDS